MELKVKRIVVKLGSNLIGTDEGYINLHFISRLAYQIKKLYTKGIKVVLVSSGAVMCGANKIGINEKPKDLVLKQALASVGQAYLMHIYDQIFSNYGMKVGQILLTLDIFREEGKFGNAKNTINKLLDMDIVPIINENDTVAVSELIFGDNDFLAVCTAYMIEADLIVMYSTAGGVRDDGNRIIRKVKNIEEALEYVKNINSGFGTGGMRSKLEASRIASLIGIPTIITGMEDELVGIIEFKTAGTIIEPAEKKVKSRKKIITMISQPRGIIYVDDGAVKALKSRKSLLPAGVVYVEGSFSRGDIVSISDREGNILGKGKTSFSSDELIKIKGKKTKEVKNIIRNAKEEVIHADNIIIY